MGTYEELIASPTSKLKSMLDDCAESIHAVEPALVESPSILCRESTVWDFNARHILLHSAKHVPRYNEVTDVRGRLNVRVFCVYAKAMGVWLWVLVMVAYMLFEVFRVVLDIYLTTWWSDDLDTYFGIPTYLGIPDPGNTTANLRGM